MDSESKNAKLEHYLQAKSIIKAIFEQDGFFHDRALGQAGQRGDALAGAIAGAMLRPKSHFRNTVRRDEATDRYDIIDKELQYALNAARNTDNKTASYLADRALKFVFKYVVRWNRKIPQDLLSYIAEVSVAPSDIKLPSRKAEGGVRDSLICWAISRTLDLTGILATRGEHSAYQYSACDAVAEILGSIDRDAAIQYDAVKDIWEAHKGAAFRPSALWEN